MTQRRDHRTGRRRGLRSLALLFLTTALAAGSAVATADVGAATPGRATVASAVPSPSFGPNVLLFDPSMSVADIQTKVDAVAAQQVGNEMGSARYALLFKPGTYGSAAQPLNFQVGYYTEVAGLGRDPGDVVINGSVYVRNQCTNGNCIALNNFWRSMSNLTVNVTNPDFGCYFGEFWAVSQAAPLRRVHVQGQTTLMDYCTGPSFASGGFIADSRFDQVVINGSQQQFFTRNSELSSWSNGVWNQVFSGTTGAPAECFPAKPDPNGCGPYTTVATTPVSREKPYLSVDASGAYNVFVPAPATDSSGVSWGSGSTPGRSIPLSRFFVASPSDSAKDINRELARGRNLLLTPGVYDLDRTLEVKPLRDAGAKEVVVRAEIRGNGDPIPMNFRLENADAAWKIYDVNISGVWLVDNYRNTFASEINASGVDGLIARLKDKNKSNAAR
jgi:hypothetical protein